MFYLDKKAFVTIFLIFLVFFVLSGSNSGNDFEVDCEPLKDASFNIQNCSVEEIVTFCNINLCNSSSYFEELDETKRGEIVGGILNFNNIPESELLRPSNRKFIDITTPEFVTFYNNAEFSFQEVIYTNLGDYKGELDEDFFAAINTEENLERFWENYDIGDISNFMGGLSWSERFEAAKGWFNPDDSSGLGDLDPEFLLELLNEKGYDLEELYFPEGFNISLYDGYLMTDTSSIELESLNNVSSLFLYENNSVIMDKIELINATRVDLRKGLYTRQADFIKTDVYKVYNSHGFNETEEKITITQAEKFLFGNTTTNNYTHTFENFSDAFFEIDNNLIFSGLFISVEDKSNYGFEEGMLNISIDSGNKVNFTKTRGRYNLTIDSENATITDKMLYTRYIEIQPGSRYSYKGIKFDPFSIFIPSYGNIFKLYLKNSTGEDFDLPSENFGFFDFINNSANIKGIFQYEKKPEEIQVFRNSINAIEESLCNMTFDNQMGVANLSYDSNKIEINSEKIELSYDDIYTYRFTDFSYADFFEEVGNSRSFSENKFVRENNNYNNNNIIMYSKSSVLGEERLQELEDWFAWLE